MQPLDGKLVVDFSRYLPGAFASRELLELGARVVCIEPPGGDPMRSSAPAWDAALRAGKDSLQIDLKHNPAPALELLAEADVVLESFRPGVASRLGIGPEHVPEQTVYCSVTGFGLGGRHEQRAGHDLNYLGWAACSRTQRRAWPPLQIADLAAGALGAVIKILAALLERDRTGKGSHVVVSMTHGSHRLIAHRIGGDAIPRMLTGGLARRRGRLHRAGRHDRRGSSRPHLASTPGPQEIGCHLVHLRLRPTRKEREIACDGGLHLGPPGEAFTES
jgi:alpha-methylacyl-CoA racemase